MNFIQSIKAYFENGDKPNQTQFAEFIDGAIPKGLGFRLLCAHVNSVSNSVLDSQKLIDVNGDGSLIANIGGYRLNHDDTVTIQDTIRKTENGAESWEDWTGHTLPFGIENTSWIKVTGGWICVSPQVGDGGDHDNTKKVLFTPDFTTDSFVERCADAGWGQRFGGCWAKLPNGWIIGGGGTDDAFGVGTQYTDLWLSTDEGVTWTQVASDGGLAFFNGRMLDSLNFYNENLIFVGWDGRTYRLTYADVLAGNYTNWVQEQTCPLPPRYWGKSWIWAKHGLFAGFGQVVGEGPSYNYNENRIAFLDKYFRWHHRVEWSYTINNTTVPRNDACAILDLGDTCLMVTGSLDRDEADGVNEAWELNDVLTLVNTNEDAGIPSVGRKIFGNRTKKSDLQLGSGEDLELHSNQAKDGTVNVADTIKIDQSTKATAYNGSPDTDTGTGADNKSTATGVMAFFKKWLPPVGAGFGGFNWWWAPNKLILEPAQGDAALEVRSGGRSRVVFESDGLANYDTTAGRNILKVTSDNSPFYTKTAAGHGQTFNIGNNFVIYNINTKLSDVLDYAAQNSIALPSKGLQTILHNLLKGITDDGYLAAMDFLTIYASNNGEAFGLLNLLDPTTYLSVKNGTLTYTNKVGYNSNGLTGYLDSSFIPSAGAHYLLNSACVFGYFDNTNNETLGLFGCDKNAGLAAGTMGMFTNNYAYTNTNVAAGNFADAAARTKLCVAFRPDNTHSKIFVNGVTTNLNENSVGVPDRSLTFLASNWHDGVQNHCKAATKIKIAGAGADMSAIATGYAGLQTRFETYLTALAAL